MPFLMQLVPLPAVMMVITCLHWEIILLPGMLQNRSGTQCTGILCQGIQHCLLLTKLQLFAGLTAGQKITNAIRLEPPVKNPFINIVFGNIRQETSIYSHYCNGVADIIFNLKPAVSSGAFKTFLKDILLFMLTESFTKIRWVCSSARLDDKKVTAICRSL